MSLFKICLSLLFSPVPFLQDLWLPSSLIHSVVLDPFAWPLLYFSPLQNPSFLMPGKLVYSSRLLCPAWRLYIVLIEFFLLSLPSLHLSSILVFLPLFLIAFFPLSHWGPRLTIYLVGLSCQLPPGWLPNTKQSGTSELSFPFSAPHATSLPRLTAFFACPKDPRHLAYTSDIP